jgi:hypothetical protein
MTERLQKALEQYLEAIKRDYDEYQLLTAKGDGKSEVQEKMYQDFVKGLSYSFGKKYVKVIKENSVHSFIVAKDDGKFKEGDILKPASWAAPAKNAARGNIYGEYSIRWTGPEYLR